MCAFANPLEIDNHNKTEAGAIMEVGIELDGDGGGGGGGDEDDGEDGGDKEEDYEEQKQYDWHLIFPGKILEEKDGNDIGRIQEVEVIVLNLKITLIIMHCIFA